MSNGLEQFRRIFGAPGNRCQSVDHGSLPTSLQYLSQHGLVNGSQRGQWVTVCCPAHKGGAEANPSMRVHIADGHFRCMACGAKGGDVIALHRLRTGLSFRDAVRDLGGHFHD